MSASREALDNLVVDMRSRHLGQHPDRAVALEGHMRFGKALEGPPGRLHGGYHAHVRTLPLLARCDEHDSAATYPCALDVHIQKPLPLEQEVAFDAEYTRGAWGWELATRFEHSDRLRATLRSLPPGPLLSDDELARYRQQYEASQPAQGRFKMFGVTVQLGAEVVFVTGRDPLHTEPGSQLADLCDARGAFGPALIAAQLDAVGAVAQGTRMRHPHFTKRIELALASGSVPASTGFVFLADRTRIEEDTASTTAPVEIKGQLWGTVRVPVALVDANFERALAVGHVTVHPVDPEKFAGLTEMRKLRDDSAA
ncbi:MAG: hypothetical protein R3B40_32195 [Polyangiales bacterium]|nr:hypothetical protein [Myxococcales bacterium]MCA9578024.1 hypothetical protein [Myxococcales bacterium]